MEPLELINAAIRRGEAEGLASLSPCEAVVFAVSEAEAYCDKDGLDALIHRYGAAHMTIFADAFRKIGAHEIASALRAIADAAHPIPEHLLSVANKLVTDRQGYSPASIESFVMHAA